MKAFLKSKAGMISLVAFAIMMALVLQRVTGKRRARSIVAGASAHGDVPPASQQPKAVPAALPPQPVAPATPAMISENAAYLNEYYDLDQHTRSDQDRQGNRLTRRQNAGTPADAGRTTEDLPAAAVAALSRGSLRLQGRPAPPDRHVAAAKAVEASKGEGQTRPAKAEVPPATTVIAPDKAVARQRPLRFNPYGRVIKCELVFTIDSTNEQTPLVAVVMEPVHNNGSLVIPAGAEFHGVTRPDRLRDRIFSGTDWVLVFPREQGRINGRQISVKGVALDRVEPDSNGMTWGITDGSYGLEGGVIRTLQQEEIKRFVATFLASGAMGMQERQSGRSGQESVRNTPQNALLQGFAANFQRMVDDISAEIEQHGVFIRVPAGHQFYFYPTQIIDPDLADVPGDVATAK